MGSEMCIRDSQDSDEVKLFHAGTQEKDGHILTAGGRVQCATALAGTVKAAQSAAVERAQSVDFEGRWFRSDIGHRAIAREG